MAEHQRHRDEEAMPRQIAEFLRRYPWSYFCTLTTRGRRGAAFLRKKFERWTRYVGGAARRRIHWFMVLERGVLGRLHLHALIGGADAAAAATLERLWHEGQSRISRYDPQRGAAYYVSKHINRADGDWDISKYLPQRDDPSAGRSDEGERTQTPPRGS
jgi:hypothetical protein